METKVCKHCGRELPLSDFYTNSKAKDGYATYCKVCSNAISVECVRKRRERKKAEAKERETQWKAYTEELLNTIRVLEEDNDEDKKLRREVKAMEKMDEDYNQLLTLHNNVVERYKLLKLQVKELKRNSKASRYMVTTCLQELKCVRSSTKSRISER